MVGFRCIYFSEGDKQNIIQQFTGFSYTVANSSLEINSNGTNLISYQNSYRYYIPVDPPVMFSHLRVQRETQQHLTICELRMFGKGTVTVFVK